MALTNKGCFKIGNNEYTAQSIRPIFESLADENSGRNENGTMVLNLVRNKMRKWEITMPPLRMTDTMTVGGVEVPILPTLIGQVQGQKYTITIWDVSTNSEQQVYVYTSNSSADMYSGVLYNGVWRNFKFSAIEM